MSRVMFDSDPLTRLSSEQLKRVEDSVLHDTIRECREFGPLSESSIKELIRLKVFSEESVDKLRKLEMIEPDKLGKKVVLGSCIHCGRKFNCVIDLDDYMKNYKDQSTFYRSCIYCNKTLRVDMKRCLGADELKAVGMKDCDENGGARKNGVLVGTLLFVAAFLVYMSLIG